MRRSRVGRSGGVGRWVVGCSLGIGVLIVLPLLARAAEKAEIEYAKGIVEYTKRNYLDALDHFRAAAEQTPDNPDVQFYLGLTLSRIGEFDAAITALEKALQLDPSKRYIHYHLGLAYFFAKRYEDALSQFEQAAQFDPKKAVTQYYLGYTHYLLKQYEAALDPLQKAIELDPKLKPSGQYYRALALFALERDDEARPVFRDVAAAEPSSPIAQNAQRYLEAIRRRARERRLLQAYASVSYQFDDNVILEPDEIEITGESDARMVFTLLGRLVPIRRPGWRAGAEYTLFQSKHFRLEDFDVQSHTAGLFGRFKRSRVTVHLAAHYNVTFLDSRIFGNQDRFSEAVTVHPRVTIRQTRSLFAVVSARYRLSNFVDPLPTGQDPAVRDRDGWSIRSGVDQYLSFNKQRSLVRVSYFYEGSRNDGSDWEYDSHEVGLGFQTALWGGVNLNASWSYTRRDYLHVHSFSGGRLAILEAADTEKRQDDRIIASLTLSRALGSYLFISFNVLHTTNLSNIAFFDYRRNIWSLTLSGRY